MKTFKIQPPEPHAVPVRRALTSIRGIAAWWIVVFHFQDYLPQETPRSLHQIAENGYLAVDLFFELSGFVIALNYAHLFDTFRVHDFRRFLGLRLARIYPLHLFMLFLFLLNPISIYLFSSHGDPGERFGVAYFVLSLLLVQHWGFTPDLAWNIPAWSISVEWFAYLVFPLLVWLSTLLAPTRGRALGLATSLLAAFAVLAAMQRVYVTGGMPIFDLLRCLVEFSCGMLIFKIYDQRRPSAGGSNVAALFAVILIAGYAFLDIPPYAIMPLAFFALICSLANNKGIFATLLGGSTLQWVGRLSFSTYMCHYFVKDWVKFLLVKPANDSNLPVFAYLLLTATVSVALYHFVELPGRRAGRAFVNGRGFASGASAPEPGSKRSS